MPITNPPAFNVVVASHDQASHGIFEDAAGRTLRYLPIDDKSIRCFHCVVMNIPEGPESFDVLGPHKRAYTWNEIHGPWLDQFPDELTAAIASLAPGQWDDIGRRSWSLLWEDDEDAVRDDMLANGPYDEIRDDIGELVQLAQASLRVGKHLFWVVPDC